MLTLAGLATALVVSVHSIVSMDFATSILHGWHSTIFPPYFVIGAIYSGFAMVVTLLVPLRKILHLENYITVTHIEKMNYLMIVTSGLIGVTYLTEFVKAHYMGGTELQYYLYETTGDYWVFFGIMMVCNVVLPQLFWIKSLRRSLWYSFVASLLVNLGMWVERFVIIVTALGHGYLPSAFTLFAPTLFDAGVFIFSVGLFFFLFLLFARFIPVVNLWEVKEMIKNP